MSVASTRYEEVAKGQAKLELRSPRVPQASTAQPRPQLVASGAGHRVVGKPRDELEGVVLRGSTEACDAILDADAHLPERRRAPRRAGKRDRIGQAYAQARDAVAQPRAAMGR